MVLESISKLNLMVKNYFLKKIESTLCYSVL
jgi:hypothetical protein